MTDVDGDRQTLKPVTDSFDSDRDMRLHELKARIQRSDYHVDPGTVAAAVIRHAISHRRWWKPRTSILVPSACSSASGGPACTLPMHVSPTAD
jgi:hypothetical protein